MTEYDALQKLELVRKVIPDAVLVSHDIKSEHYESIPCVSRLKRTPCYYTTLRRGDGIEIKILEGCWE